MFLFHRLLSFEDIASRRPPQDEPWKAAYCAYQTQNSLMNIGGSNRVVQEKIIDFVVVKRLPWRPIKLAGFKYRTVANTTYWWEYRQHCWYLIEVQVDWKALRTYLFN